MSDPVFKIAVIATAYTPYSHADVLIRRWVDPLVTDRDYEWTGARTRIASMWVMQKGEQDLSRQICSEHGILECESIEKALTLGEQSLAVDAVMIIGEHGEFPENEFKQKLYPRKELLDEILAVFDRSGRIAPIFFDKAFSWNADFAKAMYASLEARAIPWFGGSSISLCPMLPATGDLSQKEFQEMVITTWGPLEAYLFHALEVMESILEQRQGGETGVDHVIAWRDAEAWAALDRGEFSRELLEAAIAAAGDDVAEAFHAWLVKRDQSFEIFQLHFKDGVKATVVNLHGILRKWAFACRIAGRKQPVAAVAMASTKAQLAPHFARLARRIEDFFLTQVSPVPRNRLYLTTLACSYCMQALAKPGVSLPYSEIIPPCHSMERH